MKNKLLIGFVLIVSSLFFSACTLKDKAESKILNKINTKVDQKLEEAAKNGNESEEDLLKELNSDKDTNFDVENQALDADIKTN